MPKKPRVHRPKCTPASAPKPRPYDKDRLYGRRWKAKAAAFLRDNPLCVECLAEGRIVPATQADHVEPHRGDVVKFWTGKLQALCQHHHSQKTARGK